jgi:hypothetical protein
LDGTVTGSIVSEVVTNMPLTFFVLAAAIADPLLRVETGSPDAFCPSLAQATQAIHARLGTIRAEPAGWLARYTLGHAPGSGEGDFIHLQLYDPEHKLRLSRDLPIRGDSCVTMAQSIAIVLGGYFTNLSDSADRDAPSGSGASADMSVGPPSEHDAALPTRSERPEPKVTTKSERSEPTTPSSPFASVEEPSFRHHLGAGIHLPLTSSSRGLTLGYLIGVRPHHTFGLQLTVPISQITEQVDGGRVDMRSFGARLWYGAAVHSKLLSFGLGPSIALGIDVAEGVGLDQNFKQERFVVAVGSIADATWWIHRRFGIGMQGGIDLTSSKLWRRFLVESDGPDSRQEVHVPQWLNGFVGFALKFSLSD